MSKDTKKLWLVTGKVEGVTFYRRVRIFATTKRYARAVFMQQVTTLYPDHYEWEITVEPGQLPRYPGRGVRPKFSKQKHVVQGTTVAHKKMWQGS